MICPQMYTLRVSHITACEISGEMFVSKKNSIWDEINSAHLLSDNKRGLSLPILFGGGQFGRFKSNRMAQWSDMTILNLG